MGESGAAGDHGSSLACVRDCLTISPRGGGLTRRGPLPREIAPDLHTPAREQLEVTGKLVLPGFVESHIHPDKAFVADRAPGLQAGGPTPQVLLAELKKAFTVDDISQRARRALRYAVRHGCTAMRAHVEVDAYVGLRGVEALQRVQAECAGVLDLQLVAFAQ